MKTKIFTMIAMIASGIATSCKDSGSALSLDSQVMDAPLVTEEMSRKVDELYAKMTPGERLAQLQCMYMSEVFDENKQLDTAKCRRLIPNGIGHVPQYATNSTETPQEMRRMMMDLQDWLMKNTPSGVPALFHEEVLTGFCAKGSTVYPQQIGQACSFNTELAVIKTMQTATAMRQTGGMLSLSPMVDVVKNPSFNRLEESYGEDGYLSAAFGCAFVEGLQDGGLRNGVMTTSKHFLGYGGGGDAAEQELYEDILLPHEAMIRTQGSKAVMMGYHKVNDTLCTVNHYLMQHVLRDYLKFDGVIVSDYCAMDNGEIGKDKIAKAAAAINAGMEVEFPSIMNYATLPDVLVKGMAMEATVEKAVKHVLRMKAAVGLLDDKPALYSREEIKYDTPEERQTAYDIASQSIVLLKNNGVLPIVNRKSSNSKYKIALVGPNANTMWAMTGDYTYPCMKRFWHDIDVGNVNNMIVTLRQGMERLLPEGCTLQYTMGCDWTENAKVDLSHGGDTRAKELGNERRIVRDEEISAEKALAIAAESDVIVAAMGENVFLCGENRDRGSLRLPGKQEEFVRQLIATGKPVVLVMFGGRALVIGDLAEKCAAIVHAWYPGEEGGNAVADILYGNVNPSAKLSVSYPKEEINEPLCYNTAIAQDPRVEWPFGYGLSYTKYEYSDLKADASAETTDNEIHLSFKVKNIGEVAGDEVVQLYLSPEGAEKQTDKDLNVRYINNVRPIKLIGFARISLKPGEEKTVNAVVSPQQLGYYDMSFNKEGEQGHGQWTVAPGKFMLKVGASSQDIRLIAPVELTGEKFTQPLRTNYFSVMK